MGVVTDDVVPGNGTHDDVTYDVIHRGGTHNDLIHVIKPRSSVISCFSPGGTLDNIILGSGTLRRSIYNAIPQINPLAVILLMITKFCAGNAYKS